MWLRLPSHGFERIIGLHVTNRERYDWDKSPTLSSVLKSKGKPFQVLLV